MGPLLSGVDRSAGPVVKAQRLHDGEHCGGDEHLDARDGQHTVYFAMMGAAAFCDGVEGVLDSGPGVLPVPGAQLVQVIDDQDEGTGGRRELGQHPVDHGLAVELGRRGQGFGAAGRGPDRAQQRELEELRAALARPYGHEGDPVVLAWLAGPRVQK